MIEIFTLKIPDFAILLTFSRYPEKSLNSVQVGLNESQNGISSKQFIYTDLKLFLYKILFPLYIQKWVILLYVKYVIYAIKGIQFFNMLICCVIINY
jgi:hypothetical protein